MAGTHQGATICFHKAGEKKERRNLQCTYLNCTWHAMQILPKLPRTMALPSAVVDLQITTFLCQLSVISTLQPIGTMAESVYSLCGV